MLLGRLRVRGKLGLLAAVPLLAVVGLAVPVALDRVDQAQRAAATAHSVRIASQVGGLVRDLQQERLLSVGFLLGSVDVGRLQAQVATVTQHAAAVRTALGPRPPADVSAALDAVADLAELRSAVGSGTAIVDKVITGYGALVNRLIDALRLEQGVDAATPEGRQVVALDAALRTDEGINAGAGYLLMTVSSKDPKDLVPYVANLAVLQAMAARFTSFATPDQVALYGQVRSELNARLGSDFAVSSAIDPTPVIARLTPKTALAGMESLVGVGRAVEQKIVGDVLALVTSQERRALTIAYVVGGVALLVLLVVALLGVAVVRAVVRPLTRLTVSAERVARAAEAELVRVADDESESVAPVRLEPVAVTGRDEIGELARAFERVQGTAAQLVERQVASRRNVAQMFGHVGRRTQNLVGRQIALIDRLEREEADPERLQHLYRLDHVSSRLRRNAGSLVVLSGSTGANEQVNPLPLGDAVRLALAEIEDYVRVDVAVPADLVMVPGVVNDLVLVLAELMENATAFSPPVTRVTVSAARTSYGAEVTIVDHGLGLSAARLAEENARLARRERLDLAPTEVLGLFVVGRLARRHGLRVSLSPTPGGGLTATVVLTHGLLTTPPPEPRPAATPAPSTRETEAVAAPYDIEAVRRARRRLEAGGRWNAFAPPEPALAATQPGGTAALTRRVPGATLPAPAQPVASAPPAQPTQLEPARDADEARELVEQFEAGVLRALHEVQSQTSTTKEDDDDPHP
jgi:signal transduction histidine kinase